MTTREGELIEKCNEYVQTSALAAGDNKIQPPSQSDFIACIKELALLGTPAARAAIEAVTRGTGIFAGVHLAASKALELAGTESAAGTPPSVAKGVTSAAGGRELELLRRGLRPYVWLYVVLGGLSLIGSVGVLREWFVGSEGSLAGGLGGLLQGIVMVAIGAWVRAEPSRTALTVAGIGMGALGVITTIPIILHILYPDAVSGIVILGVPAAILGFFLAARAALLAKSLRGLH